MKKLIKTISNGKNIVIIRAEDKIKTIEEAETRLNQLKECFLPINPDINFVIASAQLEDSQERDNCLFFKLAPSPSWKGDDASWDGLFNKAIQLFGR